MKKALSLEEQLYNIGLVFLVSGALLVYIYWQFILPNISIPPCAIFNRLGIYCPGCGGTRAVNALFHGRILESLWYHPLVLYTAIVFSGFMLTHTMAKFHIPHFKGWKFHDWYLWWALILVAGNWILKNILLIGFHIAL